MPNKNKLASLESGLNVFRGLIADVEKQIPDTEKWAIDKLRATESELAEAIECYRAKGIIIEELVID